MKTLLGVVFMATMLIINPPKAHTMFGHTAVERQRRISAEQQLSQERQKLSEEEQRVADQQRHVIEQQQLTNRWQTTAFILGVSAFAALIIGTAIGSRGRDHAARGK